LFVVYCDHQVVLWSLDHQDCNLFFTLALCLSLLCRGNCVWALPLYLSLLCRGDCVWALALCLSLLCRGDCVLALCLSLLSRGDCVWERSSVIQVQSCNFSVEVPLWKVLCEHSKNPSVQRRGRRVVARTSKHILLFTFDPLSLNSISLISCITLYCIYSYARYSLCVCSHLCWTKRASYSTSTLNLEECWGDSPEPFTSNLATLFDYT